MRRDTLYGTRSLALALVLSPATQLIGHFLGRYRYSSKRCFCCYVAVVVVVVVLILSTLLPRGFRCID